MKCCADFLHRPEALNLTFLTVNIPVQELGTQV